MKKFTKRLILLFPVLAMVSILLMSYGGDENSDYPGGSPAGYTGSPGDAKNCTQCHGGTASSVTGWITSNIPPAGYTPGTSYTITVTVTGSGKKGFEVSPQNLTGTLLGTLAAGSGSELAGSGKYVTQSSGVNSNPATWSFTWTAPAAGTGDVTFYGAFTVSEPVTKLSTLLVHEGPPPMSATATATPSQICTGGQSQLNAIPVGGSGTYTYSWTSQPAGFTSTLKDPMVQPIINTTYYVTVNDGTSNANAQTTVSVLQNATAFAGNDTTICSYITGVDIFGTCQNYSSVVWTTSGNGTFDNANSVNTVYHPGSNDITNGAVTLTITANATSPCSTPASSAKIITIIPCNPLTANASATPGQICAGSQSHLDVNPSGGSGSYTYSWTSVPAGFTSTLKDPWVQPNVTTTYYVAVMDGSSIANSETTVAVTPMPVANAGTDTLYCNDVTVFSVTGSAANYSSVLWTTSGDGVFTNPTSLTTDYNPGAGDISSASVTLTFTASSIAPCTGSTADSKTVAFVVCSGIQSDADQGMVFRIAPNPAHSMLQIAFTSVPDAVYTLDICNLQGVRLIGTSFAGGNGITNQSFDISTIPEGIYLVGLGDGQNRKWQKLVIK